MTSRPLLIVPILLQYIVLFGIGIIGYISSIVIALILSKPGTPFASLFEVFSYLAALPDTQTSVIPAALVSDAALATALREGFFSWQGMVIALVLAVFILLAVLASAYVKSLTLGIMHELTDGKRANLIAMMRAGRMYWRATVRYFLVLGVLFYVLLLLVIPISILASAYPLMHGELEQPVSAIGVLFLGILILTFLVRTITLFADAFILGGSTKPVKDSVQYSGKNGKEIILLSLTLIVVAVIVFALNTLLAALSTSTLLVILMNVLGLLLFALWRLFVSALLIARWRERNLGQRATQPL